MPYVLASVICMAPGTLAYTWLGYAGREAVAGNEAVIRYGLIGIAVLAAVAFVARLLRRFKGEEAVRWIEIGELASRLDGPKAIALIDVRGPDEFAGPLGHILKARNVPLAELPGRIKELGSLAETPVVLVCQTDKRSASAAALFDATGFREVMVLRGGMVRWNQAGLRVADQILNDPPYGTERVYNALRASPSAGQEGARDSYHFIPDGRCGARRPVLSVELNGRSPG
jgi:rhodanese-related sulfurtransferase